MQITKIQDKLIIIFPFDRQIVDQVKKCPDVKWHPEQKQWESKPSSLYWLYRNFPKATYLGFNDELNSIQEQAIKHFQLSKFLIDGLQEFLYPHQKETIKDIIKNEEGYNIFHPCGTGKSLLMLELIRLMKQCDISPALVLCPLISIKMSWENDCIKFENEHLKFCSLREYKTIPQGYDLYILNYEMARKRIDELKSFGFQILVCDESSKLKDFNALQTQLALELAQAIPYKYCLSGTPAPNSELEYWAQLKIIGGTTDNFYKWRGKFFYATGFKYKYPNYKVVKELALAEGIKLPYRITTEQDYDLYKKFAKHFIFWDFQLRPSKKEEFMQQFKGRASFIEKVDVIKLPPKIPMYVPIALSKEERAIYNEAFKEAQITIQDKTMTLANALVVYGKLRQIISGFVYEKAQTVWKAKELSKLEALGELLEELGNNQSIIWIQFIEEREQISRYFEDKYNIGYLTGQETEKEKSVNAQNFIDGKTQLLIAHPETAKFSLSFTNCNYMIYYSRSFSLEQWQQSLERTERIGQTKTTFYYILKVEDTIDELIDDVLLGKEKLSLDLLRRLK